MGAMSAFRSPILLSVVALAAPQAPAPDATKGASIEARIESIRAAAGVPALGGALVTLDGLARVWVAGTRRAGGEERVTADDLWHLGSCTKSMTATLIALLVTRGDLAWDTPLGESLPELATQMDVDFLDVTLVDLVCHRAGIRANPSNLGKLVFDLSSLVEQREEVALVVLSNPPVHPPKGNFLYSNTGFILAGHLAEVATGKPWEELIRTLLFEPLGMASAGFGAPGTEESCDQPRGHGASGTPVEPGPRADNPRVLGPAGTVHASLADWAKYVQLHLRGARADVKVGEITLARETFARLHAPYPGKDPKYGYGWVFEKPAWVTGGGSGFWHNGSNTMWYCVTWLEPEKGMAVLVAANQAAPKAEGAVAEVAALLLQEHERLAKRSEER